MNVRAMALERLLATDLSPLSDDDVERAEAFLQAAQAIWANPTGAQIPDHVAQDRYRRLITAAYKAGQASRTPTS